MKQGGGARIVRWLISHVLTPVAYAAVATLLVATVQTVATETMLAGLERDVLGWMLLHRPSRPVNKSVAFVVVDTPLYEQQEATEGHPETPPGKKKLADYRPVGCGCSPVPRTVYALAVNRLAKWGAKAVIIDVMFRADRPCKVEDPLLSKAIEQAGMVVIPFYAQTVPLNRASDPTSQLDLIADPPLFSGVATVASPVVSPRDKEYALELRQSVRLGDSGNAEDYFAMAWEGVCLAKNQMPEEMKPLEGAFVDGTQPRLLGSLFNRSATAESGKATAGGDEVTFTVKKGNVQLDEAFYKRHLLINFASGADPAVGRYYPTRLSWLLECTDEEGRTRFGDKLVLIGNPARDRHRTVVGAMPGTEVLANAAATLMENRPLRAVPANWVLLLMFGLSTLCVVLIRETPSWVATIGLLALAAGVLAFSQNLVAHDWWLLTVCPLGAAAISVGGIAAWESGTFRDRVAQLVPARIAGAVQRAGGFQVEEGSVIFSDIRGYTTMSEKMDPAQLMTYLNRYMTSVDDVLRKHGGHFLKAPGDCILAWFGEERRGPKHQERALRAGLEILENSRKFAVQWKADTGLDFEVGVGVNSGPMAVGVLDARRHLEPTVIGDAVNTAARIEAATRTYECPMLVSEETLETVKEKFDAEFVDEVQLRGREQPVRLYRLLAVTYKLGPGMKPGAAKSKGADN